MKDFTTLNKAEIKIRNSLHSNVVRLNIHRTPHFFTWCASWVMFLTCFFLSSQRVYSLQCGKTNSRVGLVADLSMLQHQLRGTVEVLDDCTFKVDKFDMLPGTHVYWWGAVSDSLNDMMAGRPVSSEPLEGTFNSETLQVTLENVTWDEIGVLAVWSTDAASDYGHITVADLGQNSSNSTGDEGDSTPPPPKEALAPAPVPGHDFDTGTTPMAAPGPAIEERVQHQSEVTMMDNCMQLNSEYRVWWTLNKGNDTVEIALEAAVDVTQYLAFGWAEEGEDGGSDDYMMHADLVVAGFNESGDAFAEDYFVLSRGECNWDRKSPQGVCPDSFFTADVSSSDNSANDTNNDNVELVWGQRIDGITFIRFRRPLLSPDTTYDRALNVSRALPVIWATGALRPADSLHPHPMTPTPHGPLRGTHYGVVSLQLDQPVDSCHSVLLPPDPPDTGLVLVADRGAEFKLTADVSVHYPNPPSPGRSLYVNGHEAPVLRVERGVPVQFSIQAGHDLPVYVTSDPIGGQWNPNETVYAGGEDAHGVPAVPFLLTWTPNHTTPSKLYYQVFSQPKMGWEIEVVDGGLSDMYTDSALLADEKVTLFWSVAGTQVSFAVRGERPSGYLALGFGSGMVNSFTYVGWTTPEGHCNVSTYYIDSRDASGVHAWQDELSSWHCASQQGKITFEFSRALKNSNCSKRCNVIEPSEMTKVVWAMGTAWTSGELTSENMHSASSSKATMVNLTAGTAQVEMLQPVFAVHGFMMFISWGILLPGGVLAARYLRNHDWFRLHLYTQWAGISVMLLGLLFAVGEMQGFDLSSTHAKLGLTAISIALWQPLNAYFRPLKTNPSERPKLARMLWWWTHVLSGRTCLLVGASALLSGIIRLNVKYEDDDYAMQGLAWLMLAWIVAFGALIVYWERTCSPGDRWQSLEIVRESGTVTEWRNGQLGTTLESDNDDDDDDATQDLLGTSREPSIISKTSKRTPRGSPEFGPRISNGELELEPLPR